MSSHPGVSNHSASGLSGEVHMLNPMMLMPHLGTCTPGLQCVSMLACPAATSWGAEATGLFSCRLGTPRRWSPLPAKLQLPVATLKSKRLTPECFCTRCCIMHRTGTECVVFEVQLSMPLSRSCSQQSCQTSYATAVCACPQHLHVSCYATDSEVSAHTSRLTREHPFSQCHISV